MSVCFSTQRHRSANVEDKKPQLHLKHHKNIITSYKDGKPEDLGNGSFAPDAALMISGDEKPLNADTNIIVMFSETRLAAGGTLTYPPAWT